MDNGFGESNCCPSGVPNSLVYGLQFCCPVGNCHPPPGWIRSFAYDPQENCIVKKQMFLSDR